MQGAQCRLSRLKFLEKGQQQPCFGWARRRESCPESANRMTLTSFPQIFSKEEII
jgi:hypothetical protein